MRQTLVRWSKRALLLAISCAVVFAGYRVYLGSGERVIRVCVLTDIPYRVSIAEHPWDTKARLLGRFLQVNEFFAGSGVQWEASFGGDIPEDVRGSLEERRARLDQSPPCTADVVLGLTGGGKGDSSSGIVPFAHALLVRETASDSEVLKTLAMSRALGLLFGIDRERDAVVATNNPEGGLFDHQARELIYQLRHYEFSKGMAQLPGKWESRAVEAITKSLFGKVEHPAAEAHRVLARTFAVAAKPSSSVAHLREAVRLAGADARLRLEFAFALKSNFQSKEALAELAEASRLDPADARPHGLAATIYLEQQRPFDAVDELRAAVAADPGSPEYHSALGQAYLMMGGRAVDARKAFETALRIAPGDRLAAQGLEAMERTSRTAAAESAVARDLVRRNPQSAAAHFRLGLAAAQSGDLQFASSEFKQTLALQPTFAFAHVALAQAYFEKGEFAAAKEELRAAQRAGTEVPLALVMAVERRMGRSGAKNE